MINYFVSRKTTSFSPVDDAKVKGPKKQNNTKNTPETPTAPNLHLLALTCTYLPLLNDQV